MAERSWQDFSTIQRLLFDEARLLDAHRYDAWLELLDEGMRYWVPALASQQPGPDHISIIDEDKRLLRARVHRLSSGLAPALQPMPRTRRLLGNITCTALHAHVVTITSSFIIVEAQGERMRLFAGEYRHEVSMSERPRILSKRVDLLDCDASHRAISILF